MNKNQWFVWSIGLILFGGFMFKMASSWSFCANSLNDAMMISCTIRKYAFSIPALISITLGWIFAICGFLESKKK